MSRTSLKDMVTPHDLVVLSVLAEEPMHGYRLLKVLRERDVEDWAAMSKPQIYYSLKKLHTKRLIKADKSTMKKAGTSGPDGDVFTLTDSGSTVLKEGLSDLNWSTQRPPPPFLTWMAMASHVGKQTKLKMIESRKEFLLLHLKREQQTFEDLAHATDPMAKPGKLMVELTIKQFELELEWLKKVMEQLIF